MAEKGGEWPVGKLDLRAGVACGGEDGVEERTGSGGGAGGDRQRGRGAAARVPARRGGVVGARANEEKFGPSHSFVQNFRICRQLFIRPPTIHKFWIQVLADGQK